MVRIKRVEVFFAQDGLHIGDDGKITGGHTVGFDDRLLARIDNPDAIHEHLVRIGQAVGNDCPARGAPTTTARSASFAAASAPSSSLDLSPTARIGCFSCRR